MAPTFTSTFTPFPTLCSSPTEAQVELPSPTEEDGAGGCLCSTRLSFLTWRGVSPPLRIYAEGPSPSTLCSHSRHSSRGAHTSAHAHEHLCAHMCNVHMCIGISGASPELGAALSLHFMPPQASPLELCTWPGCVARVSLPGLHGGWAWGLLRVPAHPALQPVCPLLICLPLFLLLSPEGPGSGALRR